MNKTYNYCSNCGKIGHTYNKCHTPITSMGIIVFRKSNVDSEQIEFLMIRRKDTLGYVDFLRGKYPLYNIPYLKNIIGEMTIDEKFNILTKDFSSLWSDLWGENLGFQYRNEERISKDKFKQLKTGINYHDTLITIDGLIRESPSLWGEPEWGFPKGRRDYREKDIACALREFSEETGYNKDDITIIENCVPIEENFTGSNYKSYKHKYYLAYMNENIEPHSDYQCSEVSSLEWKSFDKLQMDIRTYNLERKEIITKLKNVLEEYRLLL
jgi:8-oxo-dGTP pyrophosphatase MutT (NUDIX family)